MAKQTNSPLKNCTYVLINASSVAPITIMHEVHEEVENR